MLKSRSRVKYIIEDNFLISIKQVGLKIELYYFARYKEDDFLLSEYKIKYKNHKSANNNFKGMTLTKSFKYLSKHLYSKDRNTPYESIKIH